MVQEREGVRCEGLGESDGCRSRVRVGFVQKSGVKG